MSDVAAAEVFRQAGEAIALPPDPTARVAERVRARRRTRRRWGAGVAVALLAGVALGTWLGTRPDEPPLPETQVTAQENPADVAWYADGVLHLPEVAVAVPQVRELVEVPDGAVYVDAQGRVVLVDGQGTLDQLGRTDAGTPLAAWHERGWVAWLDTSGDDPELVVHDTLARSEVGRLAAPGDVRPVALEQDRLHYVQDGETWAWPLPDEEPARAADDGLLDVASAVRVSQVGDSLITITQPLFDLQLTLLGTGATVSPEGDLVLTRVDVDRPDEVRIYEAGSGDLVRTGIRQSEVALAAAFGPGHTVTYVVAVREHEPDSGEFLRLSRSGPQILRSCDLDLQTCRTVAELDNGAGGAVLAH